MDQNWKGKLEGRQSDLQIIGKSQAILDFRSDVLQRQSNSASRESAKQAPDGNQQRGAENAAGNEMSMGSDTKHIEESVVSQEQQQNLTVIPVANQQKQASQAQSMSSGGFDNPMQKKASHGDEDAGANEHQMMKQLAVQGQGFVPDALAQDVNDLNHQDAQNLNSSQIQGDKIRSLGQNQQQDNNSAFNLHGSNDDSSLKFQNERSEESPLGGGGPHNNFPQNLTVHLADSSNSWLKSKSDLDLVLSRNAQHLQAQYRTNNSDQIQTGDDRSALAKEEQNAAPGRQSSKAAGDAGRMNHENAEGHQAANLVSKRSSADKLKGMQAAQLLPDSKQSKIGKKSLLVNSGLAHAYNNNKNNSMSTHSLVSGEIASTIGMIGAQSKLQLQNQGSTTMPQPQIMQKGGSAELLKLAHEKNIQKQVSGRSSNLNRTTYAGPQQSSKDASLKQNILFGTKLKARQQKAPDLKKLEKDEAPDGVLQAGQEQEMKQSLSSSVIHDSQANHEVPAEQIRVTKGGIIVNEYGQNAASHHFLLNLDGKKRGKQKTSGASPVNANMRNRSHKSIGSRAGQSKLNQRNQKQNRDMRTIKFFGDLQKLKDEAHGRSDQMITRLYSVKRGMESPIYPMEQMKDQELQSSQENYQMLNSVQDPARIQPRAAMPGNMKTQENIFLSNLQNNLLKRPTSMPSFNENGQKQRQKSLNGPTIKETFKNSDKFMEASDITTSAGQFADLNKKQPSSHSKQYQVNQQDQQSMQLQLDQQRLKIEYLTKLNEELMKERSSRKPHVAEYSLSSQNFDNLGHNPDQSEPYNHTPEGKFALNDDFLSINIKSNNMYGTVNINKLITGKARGTSRNTGLNKLDRKGYKTQNGAFFRNSRKGSKEATDLLKIQDKGQSDRTSQPSLQLIRQSIPVYSNIRANKLPSTASGLPRLPLYNMNSSNINVKMPAHLKLAHTDVNSSFAKAGDPNLDDQVRRQQRQRELQEKQLSEAGLQQKQKKPKKATEKQNQSFSGIFDAKIQTQQSSRIEIEDDQTLKKDIALSDTKTDNRQPNTTILSEEDMKNQGDPIRNLELGLQMESEKEPNHQKSKVHDERPKVGHAGLSLELQDENEEKEWQLISEKVANQSAQKTPQGNNHLSKMSPMMAKSIGRSALVSKALSNVRVRVTDANDRDEAKHDAGSIYVAKHNKLSNLKQIAQAKTANQGIAQASVMLQSQGSKLHESASANVHTSHVQGVMASNMTNLPARVNKEFLQLSRLNNELKKFKMMLQDQEQDSMQKQQPIDGVKNLQELVNKILVPKLGGQSQLASVLKLVLHQIKEHQRLQQTEMEKQQNLMKNQIEVEKSNYQDYKTLALKLQQQLEYEQKGLDRFLKDIGKENVLEMIKDYEKMGPLPVDSLLISKGRVMKSENKVEVYNNPFEESTRYSGLGKELQIQLQMMKARAGDFLSDDQIEMLSALAPKNQINEQEVIEKVENALLLCFSSLQTTTAKQVLQRCIKKIIQRDQATQMGVDMFEEERVSFRMQIEALNEQIEALTQTSNSLTEINKRLMGDKAEQSRQARQAKEQLERAQLLLTQATQRYNSLLSQHERSAAKIQEKNAEIVEQIAQNKRLQQKLDDLHKRLKLVDSRLETKRHKKQQYKQQVTDLLDQLVKADEDQYNLQKKLQSAQDNMANGQVRKLRRVRRPVSSRGKLSFQEKRMRERLNEQNLMGTNLKKPGASTSQTGSPNPNSGKRDGDGGDRGDDLDEEDEDGFTEESYYVPLEEAYQEAVMQKERDSRNASPADGSTLKKGDQLMTILSDEQYIKMADSLGILDVSMIDADFTLTREEALERINEWFATHDPDKNAPEHQVLLLKAKTAMANELYRRFSLKNQKTLLQKMKTRKVDEGAARPAAGLNIDALADSEVDKLYKKILERKRRKTIVEKPSAEKPGSTQRKVRHSREFTTLNTDSDLQNLDNEEKLRQIISEYVKHGDDIQIQSNGMIQIGGVSGDPHFDLNLKPVMDKASGLPRIYDKAGNHIRVHLTSKNSNSVTQSGSKNVAMIKVNKGVDSNDHDKFSDYAGLLVPKFSSDQQQPNFLDQAELKDYREWQKQMRTRRKMVDSGVQVDTWSLGFKLLRLSEQVAAQCQTYEHYFPYDEETRMRIANILGNKLHSSSDMGRHSHQSLSSMLLANASYLMHGSAQASQYMWPKNKNRCKTFEPIKLSYRLNKSSSPKPPEEKKIKRQTKSTQRQRKPPEKKAWPKQRFTDDLPPTDLNSPNHLNKMRHLGLPSNPYGIMLSEEDPIEQIVNQSLKREPYQYQQSPTTERDKSGQVSFVASCRESQGSTQRIGNRTGRFANEALAKRLGATEVNLKIVEQP